MSVPVEVRRETVALPAAVESVAKWLSPKGKFGRDDDLMGACWGSRARRSLIVCTRSISVCVLWRVWLQRVWGTSSPTVALPRQRRQLALLASLRVDKDKPPPHYCSVLRGFVTLEHHGAVCAVLF